MTTRSASRSAGVQAAPANKSVAKEPATRARVTKRKAVATPAAQGTTTNARKKARPTNAVDAKATGDNLIPRIIPPPPSTPPVLVPAKLTFDFEEAKRHLIAADPRFEELFARLKCRPFEHLEQVDPFRFVLWFQGESSYVDRIV